MEDFDSLRFNLECMANNLRWSRTNRIDEVYHNMDMKTFEKNYQEFSLSYNYYPEDIEEGNEDLEMYEKWLKD